MLITEYLTLCTAGATIDGRVIEESWLEEAAENYDTDLYTAVIDAEHFLDWYGSFGHVHDVRLGKNKDGKMTLEGRICPNQRLIEMNSRGQRTFFSIQLAEDFADTGKHYLFRLALTDQPASLGTSQLKFSANPDAKVFTASEFSELAFSTKLKSLEVSEDHSGSGEVIKKFFSSLLVGSQNDQSSKDEEAMNQQQFETLEKQNSEIISGLGDMTKAFKNVADNLAGGGDDSQESEEPESTTEEKQYATNDQFSELTSTIKSMNEKVEAVQKEFAELKGEEVPGTHVPDNAGATDEVPDIL